MQQIGTSHSDTLWRVAAQECALTGESPVWDAQCRSVFWVDIRGKRVFATAWEGRSTVSWRFADLPAYAIPKGPDLLLVAGRNGLSVLDMRTGKVTLTCPAWWSTADMRLNDGTVDPLGRLVIGTMSLDPRRPMNGVLYALDGPNRITELIEGLGIVNGLAFSPDGGTLYVADSHPDRRIIWRFAYDIERARVSGREAFVDFAGRGLDGVPDGAAVSADGSYLIAAHGNGALLRFGPEAELLERHPVPAAMVSKPAFVGPALDHVAVTSFADPDAPDDPNAGRLLFRAMGVRGSPQAALGLAWGPRQHESELHDEPHRPLP